MDDYWKKAHGATVIFPRAKKLYQPVLAFMNKAEIPSESDSVLSDLYFTKANKPEWSQENPVVMGVKLHSDLRNDPASVPVARALSMPKNHGIPAGLVIDLSKCHTGADLARCVSEASVYPVNHYEFLTDSYVTHWFGTLHADPVNMAVDAFILYQVSEWWQRLLEIGSIDAQKTFQFAELSLQYCIALDAAATNATSRMAEKLVEYNKTCQQLLLANSELSFLCRSNSQEPLFGARFGIPATKAWNDSLHLRTLRTIAPAYMNGYTVAEIANTPSETDLSANSIVLKVEASTLRSPSQPR